MTATMTVQPTTLQQTTYGRDASLMRFTVEQYQAMIEGGILTADDRVELLEQWVVLKMPKSPEHDGTIDLAGAALRACLPVGWLLRVQSAIALQDSQPEPDFAVVRGDVRAFLRRHLGPADIALLIEVAHTSLLRDQRDKARIYARAGIVAYWVINLEDRHIEAHEQPSGPTAAPAYGQVTTHRPGERITIMLDRATVDVAVDDLLP